MTGADTSAEAGSPAATPDAIAALRLAQATAYDQEDFAACFIADERLAAADPGYAGSYVHQMQKILHAFPRTTPAHRFLKVGGKNITRVARAASRSGAVPDWAEGLGSFHPDRNALGGIGIDADLHAVLRQHTVRETVGCLTLASVAERTRLDRMDLLQVDAEGCELGILRQVIDGGYKPRVIQLEHWALPEGERDTLQELLRESGYSVSMSEADLLATKTVW